LNHSNYRLEDLREVEPLAEVGNKSVDFDFRIKTYPVESTIHHLLEASRQRSEQTGYRQRAGCRR
jgi:hypothetical protein